MSLVLTVLRQPKGANLSVTKKVFGREGGTLGRTEDNAWVLPDPFRIVSAVHANIRYERDAYYLMDVSTNGTFVNDFQKPLGAGKKVLLKTGDRLAIGHYRIAVQLKTRPDQKLANPAEPVLPYQPWTIDEVLRGQAVTNPPSAKPLPTIVDMQPGSETDPAPDHHDQEAEAAAPEPEKSFNQEPVNESLAEADIPPPALVNQEEQAVSEGAAPASLQAAFAETEALSQQVIQLFAKEANQPGAVIEQLQAACLRLLYQQQALQMAISTLSARDERAEVRINAATEQQLLAIYRKQLEAFEDG